MPSSSPKRMSEHAAVLGDALEEGGYSVMNTRAPSGSLLSVFDKSVWRAVFRISGSGSIEVQHEASPSVGRYILEELGLGKYVSKKQPEKKTIHVYYQRVTPESAEEGEYSEQGEDSVEDVEPDEDETAVDVAVKILKDGGVFEASSSSFHSGIWYSTESQVTDYSTGEQEEKTYHLKGFAEEEERAVYDAVMKKRRR